MAIVASCGTGAAALEREGEAVQHPGNSERMFRRKSVAN
jgi:hypothetical protein